MVNFGVTPRIRREIKAQLAREGIKIKDAAEQIGVSENHLSRMLSEGSKTRSGDLPEAWEKLLDLTRLELVVKPKDSSHE